VAPCRPLMAPHLAPMTGHVDVWLARLLGLRHRLDGVGKRSRRPVDIALSERWIRR
jgi:hypothetical protein